MGTGFVPFLAGVNEPVMERKFQQYDASTLKTIYDKELDQLHTRLLNGASWEETFEQRRLVTELSIAMNRYISPLRHGHPAEHRTRNNEMQNNSPS